MSEEVTDWRLDLGELSRAKIGDLGVESDGRVGCG